ncbi:glycosyltransferase family 29 protein [Pontibacter lucknowensis]|uniref:Glycosyltransferase family 29 (Sialyltransferase) n=1 Tax=Pontibacter lucknowensis TaxID=1077936 RepID=A0A1N6Y7I5_9BACT|nr:glycosyltransferase family 29 protein [Pontibacter lucknowensis]SIR10527.1 Glycosyltransferase family 29 (sialyltransferase) [Pontibacter lucknowensis]
MIITWNKVVAAAKGLLLLKSNLSVFDTSILSNKRVAIVGPASSAFEADNGEYIDGFDFVVRVNKSGLIVDTHQFDNKIGSRTDILFHSFFENELTGGGKLDTDLFDRQQVKYLINPRSTFGSIRNSFNFYKKYLKNYKTYTLPVNFYQKICAFTPGYAPTIGFTALATLMQARFKELYITGFTFYRTPFGEGYRDELKTPEKIIQSIKDAGRHDIELEFKGFKKLLELNKNKNIVVDIQLKHILQNTQ